jgi:hypothetical protein
VTTYIVQANDAQPAQTRERFGWRHYEAHSWEAAWAELASELEHLPFPGVGIDGLEMARVDGGRRRHAPSSGAATTRRPSRSTPPTRSSTPSTRPTEQGDREQ